MPHFQNDNRVSKVLSRNEGKFIICREKSFLGELSCIPDENKLIDLSVIYQQRKCLKTVQWCNFGLICKVHILIYKEAIKAILRFPTTYLRESRFLTMVVQPVKNAF